MGYLDSLLGGIGGGANIYAGIQEGDVGQVTGGVYESLGAYTAANYAMLYQQGLAEFLAVNVAEEGSEAAAQYASQYVNERIAEGASALPGAPAVGQWLPYVGAGLIIGDWLSGDITKESTMQAGMGVLMAFNPELSVALIPGVTGYFHRKHQAKNSNNYVEMLEPSVTIVHKDTNGNYYLGGVNFDQTKDGTTYYKFNPVDNSLEQTVVSNSESDTLENAEWEPFNPIISTEEPSASKRHNTVARMVNVPSLQAQIYNQILLPEGYAPLPENTTAINLNGKEYYKDDDGIVYRSNRQIVGKYNGETNNIDSYALNCGKYGCLIEDDKIKLDYSVLGGISDSPAYMPSEDYIQTGMPKYTYDLDAMDASGDIVSPYISETEGITKEQYEQLEQIGSINLPENYSGLGYRIDTATGDLYYNDTLIGKTEVTDNNFIYNRGEWGQKVDDGQGSAVYAASPTVWGLDGNILGRMEIRNDGMLALQINPGYSQYTQANEARKQGENIAPDTFNQYYVLQGNENPEQFSWNTYPQYPEGTMGIQDTSETPTEPPTFQPEDTIQNQQGFQGFTPIEQPEQSEQPQTDQQGFQGFTPIEPIQQTGQGGFQGFMPIEPSSQEENKPNSQGFIGFENPFEM
jgi:hypothetical protein